MTASASDTIAAIGDRVGDWTLLELIGAGGMGVVYRARHEHTHREAALKLLTGLRSPDAMARMRNEARILKRLTHPHIAQYLEYVDYRGTPCVAMRFVPGPTLGEYVRDTAQHSGRVSAERAAEIFRDVVAAVAYLHGQGIVHRDIKPENVKIDPSGRAVLLDFGIARDEKSVALTKTHAIIGTLSVLAPELLDGEPASTRSDVWALGVLLAQMLTGKVLFDASGIAQVRAAQTRGWRAGLAERVPQIGRGFARVLDRTLEVDPRRRFADAHELAAALATVSRSSGGDSPLTNPIIAASASVPPRGILSNGMLAGGVIVAAMAFAVYWLATRPDVVVTVPPVPPATTGSPVTSQLADVLVDTIGGSARVFAAGVAVGTTPYRMRLPVGTHVKLELRREGALPTPVQFAVRPIDNRYDIVLRSAP